jgi:serine/threonine protein kinase
MSELEGTIISGYRLQYCLGRGGVAEIYRAQPYGRGGNEVVIKVFRHAYVQKSAFREYFLAEAEKIAQLQHPNILPFLEYGQGEGLLYVIMPSITSGNLDDLLLKVGGRLSAMQALPIVKQLCDALTYIHVRQIIHTNLKPQNILIAEDGRMLLSDFGIMRNYDDSQQSLTRIGWGSAEYASPEQSLGIQRQSSDIYALGVLLFRILSGVPPFTGQTPVEVLLKHVRQPTPSVRSIVPGISDAVDAVLYKALQKRADQRYESVQEFYEAFQAAVRLAPIASPVARGITRTLFFESEGDSVQTQKPFPIRKLSWQSNDPVTPIPVSLALETPKMPDDIEMVADLQVEFEPVPEQISNQEKELPHELPTPGWSSNPPQWSPIAQQREPGGVALTAETYLQEMQITEEKTQSVADAKEEGALSFSAHLQRWLPIIVVVLLLLGLIGALLSVWLVK